MTKVTVYSFFKKLLLTIANKNNLEISCISLQV